MTTPATVAPSPAAATAAAVPASTTTTASISGHRLGRSILSLFKDVALNTFGVPRGRILVIDSQNAPGAAFKELLSFGVLSAPVFDKATNSYVGFLELSDILRFVVLSYDRAEAMALIGRGYDVLDEPLDKRAAAAAGHAKKKPAASEKKTPATGKAKSVSEYIDEVLGSGAGSSGAASALHTTPVLGKELTVAALAKRHPFVALPGTATVFEAAERLCRDAHRVAVLGEDGRSVVSIVSQSTVVQFLYENLSTISAAERQRTVEEWHMGTNYVRTMDGVTSRTIDVFRRMVDNSLSGIVLVDEWGSYLDLAQSSDVKLFTALFFNQTPTQGKATSASSASATQQQQQPLPISSLSLEQPIGETLATLRALEATHRIAWTLPSARVAMTMDTNSAPTLEAVITKFAALHTHQLCITSRLDDHLAIPLLMVSLGDVLRAVFRYVPPHVDSAATKWVEQAAAAQKQSNEKAKDQASGSGTAVPAMVVAQPIVNPHVDAKHTTVEATIAAIPQSVADAFKAAAKELVAASNGLAAALNERDANKALEPLLATVHKTYESVAAMAASIPRRLAPSSSTTETATATTTATTTAPAAAPAKPTVTVVAAPAAAPAAAAPKVDAKGDPIPDAAQVVGDVLPKVFNSAYNSCHHPSVAHWYTDHGHCLRATHTCARLHPNPPACYFGDNSKFCHFDLGYSAADRIRREATTARGGSVAVASADPDAVAVNAELHAAAAAATAKKH